MNASRFRSSFFVIFFCVVLLAQLFLPVAQSSALGGDGVSWSDPILHKVEDNISYDEAKCTGVREMAVVESTQKEVCVMKGNGIRFGYPYNGGAKIMSTSLSGVMQPFKFGDSVRAVYYLADKDILVQKQPIRDGDVYGAYGLMVYRDFSKNIDFRYNPYNLVHEYVMTKTEPDYTFKSTLDIDIGEGISSNNKWMAIRSKDGGIGLLNLETFEERRIYTHITPYNTYVSRAVEFAVSNDGNHIAIVGWGVSPMIIDINSSCGDSLVGVDTPIVNPCELVPFDITSLVEGFEAAIYPKFNNEGNELSFFTYIFSSDCLMLTLKPDNYVASGISYMALGDSYSSGEGELEDSNYITGTNVEYEKCHVSTNSYAFNLSYTLGLNPNSTKNVACSGAVVGDLVGDDDFYLGQNDRFGKKNLNLTDNDRLIAQKFAIESFIPGRVHQNAFVEKYQPNVITVGIGGNDVGFAAKLISCLGLDTCSWADYSVAKEKSAIEIKNLFNPLVDTYQKIHAASPHSKIYAIGYPKLIDPDGQCGLSTGLLLNDKERQFMNESVVYLNQVIAAAAKKVGIKYIDIESSLGTHVLCGDSPDGAINFIKLGDDIGPIENLKWLRFIGQESFHPNALGHQLESEAILRQVGNILTYDYCSGVSLCPQEVTAPNPSYYWTAGMVHNYPAQKIANFVTDSVNLADYIHKRLVLAINSLAPNSIVGIEINSTPRSLGRFTVSADGSLEADIELPSDLEEGYHTVHLYGRSYEGEQIELYQVIKYMKPVVDEAQTPVKETPVNNNIDENTVAVDIKTDNKAKINDFSLSSNVNSVGMLSWVSSNKTADNKIDTKLVNNANNSFGIDNTKLLYAFVVFVCLISVFIVLIIAVRFYKK